MGENVYTMGGLDDKILLILTPSYSNRDDSFIAETFVKYQVAEIKKYFKKVIVIAPVFQSHGYTKKDKLCKDYSYENVDVYYPRCFYIPLSWLNKIVIDNRLRIVERTIQKHRIKFDLIHAHFSWPSGYIGVMLKRKYGKPVITTIHENGEWFDREVKMNHPLINAAWSGSNAIIRVNRKDVPALQLFNDRVYSIPNGFSQVFYPIESIAAKEQLDIPEQAIVIFSLGNLIKRKGFNFLIDALRIICDQRKDVVCYIGGSGKEGKNLQKQIDRLHLEEKVKLLGSLPTDKLALWMNACDFFVLPSLSESFGIVQIEAMACGKPVISARNRGSEELINSDICGMLVKPANSVDLAGKILVAMDRKWDRTAILNYVRKYTWENVSRDLIDVYCQILL